MDVLDGSCVVRWLAGQSCCSSCLVRTPYASLVAVCLCWIGSGIFCGAVHRAVALVLRMAQAAVTQSHRARGFSNL